MFFVRQSPSSPCFKGVVRLSDGLVDDDSRVVYGPHHSFSNSTPGMSQDTPNCACLTNN
jgi:hypothetical protein